MTSIWQACEDALREGQRDDAARRGDTSRAPKEGAIEDAVDWREMGEQPGVLEDRHEPAFFQTGSMVSSIV